MSDQPKPTGEQFLWDYKYVDERLGRDASWPQIIDAANFSINAALAAERKKRERKQLADATKPLVDALERVLSAHTQAEKDDALHYVRAAVAKVREGKA